MKKEACTTHLSATKTELSVEKLRTYPGFETMSDSDALVHIDAIKKLARILYSAYQYDQQKNNKPSQ